MSCSLTSEAKPPPRLPFLHPTPGVLHGSRKRRAFSSHGPHAASNTYFCTTNEDEITKDSLLHDETISEIEPSSRFSPQTPIPTHSYSEHNDLTTPVDGSGSSHKSPSPTLHELPSFQHLTLRSPGRLSMSPGSSFSPYTTRSEKMSGVFISRGTSFESGESSNTTKTNICATPTQPNAQNSNTSIMKTVPLTVLSDLHSTPSRTKYDKAVVDQYKQNCNSGTSPYKPMITPRSEIRSKFLPSPRSNFIPSPRRNNSQTYPGSTIVSEEKPTTSRDGLHFNMSPSKPLGEIGRSPMRHLKEVDYDDDEKMTTSSRRPPISFLSINNVTGQIEMDGSPQLKRKSSIQSSRSLFKPASSLSNEALNDMLYSHDDGYIDGSLSDSDSENDDAFFLEDPCLLSLVSRRKDDIRSSSVETHTNNSNECDPFISAHAHYSLKNKRKKTHDGKEHDQDRNEQMKEGTSLSSTSLFGMNIIHENSVSNGSLLDLSTTFSQHNISRKNSISRNLDDSGPSKVSMLNRSKSDQSFSSIGLSIEDSAFQLGCNLENAKRDLVTPPVIHRTMLSPPPLKQTKLTMERKH